MSGKVIQPVQPHVHHFIKVSPIVLNHVISHRKVEHIIIMSININIINHEKKIMEMAGREEIPLERKTVGLII
jgi:hypothetical protein